MPRDERMSEKQQAPGPTDVPGTPKPLERLMDEFLDGDPRAFDEIFRRVAPRVVGLLRAMSGDPRLAEDLAQTTFLKVHRARDSYQRGAPLEPWVFAIARRTFIDHRRRQQRSPVRLSEDGALPEQMPEPPEGPQGFERLNDEQAAALRARLQSLPEAQREAIVLLKVQGLSTAEAAAVTGSTVGAIKLRAHRAYESLRKVLGVKSGGDA
jgi:RNA polymerase sigma-70 factor (ECF subfamily)